MDTNCTTTTTTTTAHMGKIVDEELHAILGLEGPILNHPFIQNLPVERHFHKFISLAHRVSLAIFFVIPRWLYHIIGKSYPFLLMILLGSYYDHIKNTQINTNSFFFFKRKRKRKKKKKKLKNF